LRGASLGSSLGSSRGGHVFYRLWAVEVVGGLICRRAAVECLAVRHSVARYTTQCNFGPYLGEDIKRGITCDCALLSRLSVWVYEATFWILLE
jgi:hypothetical protein